MVVRLVGGEGEDDFYVGVESGLLGGLVIGRGGEPEFVVTRG